MLRTRDNSEVFNPVVCTITVNVMDVLTGEEFPPQVGCHDDAMFSCASSSIANSPIPFFVNPPFRIFYAVAATPRKINLSRVSMVVPSVVMESAHSTSKKRMLATVNRALLHRTSTAIMQDQNGSVK